MCELCVIHIPQHPTPAQSTREHGLIFRYIEYALPIERSKMGNNGAVEQWYWGTMILSKYGFLKWAQVFIFGSEIRVQCVDECIVNKILSISHFDFLVFNKSIRHSPGSSIVKSNVN